MAKRGQKGRLTAELIKELCGLKSAGLTNKAVCDGAGIAETSFYEWFRRGEADTDAKKDTVYSQFTQSYKKAMTAHKLKRVKQIQDAAAEGNWHAAAWELERCYPDEYGKRVCNEITGKNGAAVQAQLSGEVTVNGGPDLDRLSVEELAALNELLHKCDSG